MAAFIFSFDKYKKQKWETRPNMYPTYETDAPAQKILPNRQDLR